MNNMTVSEISHKLAPVFSKYQVKKAILFGSFAKGVATENSDIDIMVTSGLKGLNFVALLMELQNAVGRDIDLFDVTHIEEGSPIQKEVENTGIIIYEGSY